MRRRFIVFAMVLTVLASNAEARDREIRPVEIEKEKFRAVNVGLTGFFTLLSAVVQGEVRSPRDAVRHFLIGSGAGLSYYHAKRMTGAGRVTEGWLLTNMTSTVIEN